MRPLLLTLTAFGPYREKEAIDFRELKEHRLFVISGNTGAGKTTIFDAICFALYGTASGEDRAETRLLRSHFADEELHTSVELLFAVKHKTYRVFRQMKHRKGNNKSETGEKIELFEVTAAGEVPAVERFVFRDVDARLEEIIGLTKDQFSQIVMLPQGEFRKLLTSSTDNKEDILRKIFRTEQFDHLEKLVGQQYKQLHDSLKNQLLTRDQLLLQVQESIPNRDEGNLTAIFAEGLPNSHQVIEALTEELVYYEQEKKTAGQKREQLTIQLGHTRKQLSEAEQFDANQKNLQLRQTELAQLEEQAYVQQGREARLTLAEKANLIVPYEERFARASEQLLSKKEAAAVRQKEWEKAAAAKASADTVYTEEQNNEEVRKKTELALHQLSEMLPVVQQYGQDLASSRGLKQKIEQYASQLLDHDKQILQLRERKQKLQTQLEHQEQAQLLNIELDNKLKEIEQQGKLLTRVIDYNKEIAALDDQLIIQKKAVQRANEAYAEAEKHWIEGQASVLAAHLHYGEHCPVCGSLEHPRKANASIETPSREMLKALQDEQRAAEQELHSLQAQRTAKAELIQQQYEQLTGFEEKHEEKSVKVSNIAVKADQLTQLTEQQNRLRQSWKMYKEQHDKVKQQLQAIAEQKNELISIEQNQEQQEKKKNECQTTMQQMQVQLAAIESRIEQLEARVPVELRELASVQQKVSEQQQLHDKLQYKWRIAQEVQHKAASHLASALAYYEEAKQQVIAAEQEYGLSCEQFKEKLIEAGFNEVQDYAAARLSLTELNALKEQYDAYKQQLERLMHAIEALKQELTGKEAMNTEEIMASLQRLEADYAGVIAHEKGIEHVHEAITRFISKIEELGSLLHSLEHKLGLLADIFMTMKGDNPLKLSFERYILIDYLEQILVMANSRLQQLSNGQFELQRSDRLETHGKQSGLGLDVYDAYTGQNRDVKTLSGGEKFNAALCLALGMTDVIQAHQGGVAIEMMFIDEGFGSLDEESLQKAIQALVELQKAGRMIGVISHVQELKTALPACLEVSKTRDGHSQTSFVVS